MFGLLKKRNNKIDIKIMKVKEEDIITVKSEAILSVREIERIRGCLNKLGINNEILVLDNNTNIEIIRKSK